MDSFLFILAQASTGGTIASLVVGVVTKSVKKRSRIDSTIDSLGYAVIPTLPSHNHGECT